MIPAQIEGWTPFWMVYAAGKRSPKKKYHDLGEACRDADNLCSKNRGKTFVLECIGLFVPEGEDASGKKIEKELANDLPSDTIGGITN